MDDEEIRTIAEKMEELRKMANPFPSIKDMVPLRSEFNNLYTEFLDREMERVRPNIDSDRERVMGELVGKECEAEFSEKVKKGFSELVQNLQKEDNVEDLDVYIKRSDALRTRLLNQITTREAQLLATKTTPEEVIVDVISDISTEKVIPANSPDNEKVTSAPPPVAQAPVKK